MTTETERIILVHGTGATASDHRGGAWWQDQGSLWLVLEQAKKSGGLRRQIEAFIWSGANSEAARREAGRALCKRLIEIDREDAGVHLIGHSHGGSVIWHALQEFDSQGGRVERTLRSWASVGTPFLKYGIRRPRWWLALIAIALAAIYLTATLISLRGVEWAYAWRDEKAAMLTWMVLAAIPILMLAWGVKAALPFVQTLLSKHRASMALTGAAAAARYLALWSTQDEPIIGLGASGSFSLKVLQDSSAAAESTVIGKQDGRLRHPVASAINQFVNNLISRAVQGSTIAHLELLATDHYPHESLAHLPLPSDIDHALIDSANENSSVLGRRVRDLLVSGRSPVTGFADLQAAAAKTMTFKELVHTSYFDDPACIALLLHHVECHATPSQPRSLPDQLQHFYQSRQGNIAQHTPGEPLTLPCNRMGLVTVLASLGVLTILVLTFISQSVLHQKALAPTTARYHLQEAIRSAQLGEVLATLFPAEELESRAILGSYDFAYSDGDVEDGDMFTDRTSDVALVPVVAMGISQRGLRRYIQEALNSGELAALMSAVNGLETPELRQHFYTRAWPLILEFATDAQLAVLLEPSSFFPGPRKHEAKGFFRDNFPAVDTAIEKLAERKKLDRVLVEKWQALCADSAYCRQHIQMAAAYALVRSNAEADPAWLRPLPPVRVTTKFVSPDGKQTYAIPVDTLDRLSVRGGKAGRFLKWASAHGDWQHVEFFSRGLHATLAWPDFAASVEKALSSAEGVTANYLLKFLTRVEWDTQLPETVLAKVKSAAARQLLLAPPPAHVGSGAVDGTTGTKIDSIGIQAVNDKAIDNFLKKETNKTACAKWAKTALPLNADADIDEVIANEKTMPPGIDCPESNAEGAGRRAFDRMEKAARAEQFNGEDSLMASFSSARNSILSANNAGWWSELLMAGLKRAACGALTYENSYYSWLPPEEEHLLADAFNALGSAPANLPAPVTKWIESAGNPATLCMIKRPPDSIQQEEFITRTRLFTFYLANWLHGTHENLARTLMQRLSGLIKNSLWTEDRKFEQIYEQVVRWLQKKTYAVDALYASNGSAYRYRLIRRAAYYHIAACEQTLGREDRALRVAQLAQQSGYAARTFGRPGDLTDVMVAEARYHATRHDWRSASNVCNRCDSAARLVVTLSLMPELSVAANGSKPPKFECDILNDAEFDKLMAVQEAIDKRQAAVVE